MSPKSDLVEDILSIQLPTMSTSHYIRLMDVVGLRPWTDAAGVVRTEIIFAGGATMVVPLSSTELAKMIWNLPR